MSICFAIDISKLMDSSRRLLSLNYQRRSAKLLSLVKENRGPTLTVDTEPKKKVACVYVRTPRCSFVAQRAPTYEAASAFLKANVGKDVVESPTRQLPPNFSVPYSRIRWRKIMTHLETAIHTLIRIYTYASPSEATPISFTFHKYLNFVTHIRDWRAINEFRKTNNHFCHFIRREKIAVNHLRFLKNLHKNDK